jgi:catechol 2,3-dioxygenase-like lactoylglutathione lyase family enzyme
MRPDVNSGKLDATSNLGITMAVIGTHALLYTSEPEALRACLRDAFGWRNIDAHDGWLIFALPPAELGVHPAEAPAHELSFMCDDIRATISELAGKGVVFEGEPEDRGFGIAVKMVLPGGVGVLLYEPRHPTAI